MKEWDVVLVIIALVGLFASVIAPVVKLTKAISRLTTAMETVQKNVSELTTDNKSEHERIWGQSREQDKKLCDHEARIRVMEEDRE